MRKKLSKLFKFYYLEPGLYPSITDIVEAINNLIQERHNHSENCLTVKKSRGKQKVDIYVGNERSGLAFVSTDLGNFFRAMLAMNLESCWEENDLTNQNLLLNLSTYIFSWYTRT